MTSILRNGLSQSERKWIYRVLNAAVLVLSAALIAYISIDSFRGIPFLSDSGYMRFQLWICIFFMADFFIELFMAKDRWRYFRRRWLFLVLSVPVLNIVTHFDITLSEEAMYFARFIPLARGALAMATVVGYVSTNKVTSIFATYTVILLALIYFGSLIFMEREHTVNPMVPNYWSALWWACMDATTSGCPINPVTVAGKVVGCVLAVSGMLMFPLFTVFITNLVRQYNAKLNARKMNK